MDEAQEQKWLLNDLDNIEQWNCTLTRNIQAKNDHKVSLILNTFAERAIMEWDGVRYVGREPIRRFLERFGFGGRGAFSLLQVMELNRHHTPTSIILEQRLSGRHAGAWEGIAPTFKAVEVPFCTVYEFDERGLILRERPYMDRWMLRKQLR